MNFNGVETPVNGNAYLLPGMYMLTPVVAEYGVSSQKGTPYMDVTFTCKSKNLDYNGKSVKAKFYITENSRARLQYLHEGLYGVKIDPNKNFASEADLVTYFNLLFSKKPVTKPFVAGGSISNDGTKIYSDLPYTGFIVPESYYEEGEYEVNSSRFKNVITSDNKVYTPSKNGNKTTDLNSDAPILASSDFERSDNSSTATRDDVDDLPF
jgi:hypothetical protein